MAGKPIQRIVTSVLFAAAAACGSGDPLPMAGPTPIDPPAEERSSWPFVSATQDGRALLTWLEAGPDSTHALRLAAWTGLGWSPPRTVAVSRAFFVNWADFPSIIELPDGTLAIHWLERPGPGSRAAYDVRLSISRDGGLTWSAPVTPHRDATLTEHGFVSLFAEAEGVGAVWLDGRNMNGGMHGGGGDMTLRYTRIGTAGDLADEVVLDDRTCECCQTDAAITAQGPVVVYRDRSPDEIRDIAVTRRTAGGWTVPAPVHRDGWHIRGCPVNGPAVAASDDRVAVAWFTAAQDTARVLLAFSEDAGATFRPPVRVDDGDPAGRVDVLLHPGGAALVAWLERTGDGAELRIRAVRGRRAGPSLTVAETSAERSAGFARMAFLGDRLLIAWTEPGLPRVRAAMVDFRSP